jgi:hypothetical protein
MEDGNAAERNQHDCNEAGRQHRVLSASLYHQTCQELRRPEPAKHAEYSEDASRTAPSNDIDRRNRRQQVEPSPRSQILPAIRRPKQTDQEIAQEDHADEKVRLLKDDDGSGFSRTARLVGEYCQGIHTEHEHEHLVAR